MHDAAGVGSAGRRHPARRRQRKPLVAARDRLAGDGRVRQRDFRESAAALRHRRGDWAHRERRRVRARRHGGLRRPARRDGNVRQAPWPGHDDGDGHSVDRDRRLRRHYRGAHCGGGLQSVLPARAAELSRFLRGQALGAHHHRLCGHRRRRRAERGLAADRAAPSRRSLIGRWTRGRRWPSPSTAWSSAR